ncbi:MAG: glycoside hydrolase family 3 C-terminal domain-containing protein [Candidatus Limiplasma sp.]|nr:glycoside hydrolase family 3 C-terminal domain-containing protein [Candidatus Limiplasma sp.]
MNKDIKALVQSLTLEEKASLCSGMGLWQTKPIPEKGIPEIWMADGSNGIRIQKPKEGLRAQAPSDFLKITDLTQNSPTITDQWEAVCYPSGAALAATWNMDLIEKMAQRLGDECRYRHIHILLAPGINIKRSPLGGRGYEYYSEDPYLTGATATAFIRGVQRQGVGTSIKHYAANNAETLRINMSSDVQERALREIYLAPFEKAVKEADPWTVMSSYNKVNGVQMAENPLLLNGVLREEWGWDGVVVCDWGGIKDREAALRAGNDLQMPENRNDDALLVEAVRSGALDEDILDTAIERILKLVLRSKEAESFLPSVDWEAHRQVAREVAEESLVLLKNEDHLLPLGPDKYKKVAVIGAFAKEPRYQGGGSTLVNPVRISIPYAEMEKRAQAAGMALTYAPGYLLRDETTPEMLREAQRAAEQADVAVVFAGLWVAYDREGFDRKKLTIDESHIALIQAVCQAQKKVVVVLSNGDAVTMHPWIENVGAVLQQLLVGEVVGEAVAAALFGAVNPSGKLPVTYPKRLEDTPGWPWFPGENNHHVYGEGVLVGYRFYDKRKVDTLFPFGYGLSYTEFAFENLTLDKRSMPDTGALRVSVEVVNTGKVAGAETVQVYVAPPEDSRLLRPLKELRAFAKVTLAPGERRLVAFELGFRDFACYDPELMDWCADSGVYGVLVCKHAEDPAPLKAEVEIQSTTTVFRPLYLDSQHRQVFAHPTAKRMYLDFLVDKGVLKAEELETMAPLLMGNYMGIYNVVTSLLGAKIRKAELQELLDNINRTLGKPGGRREEEKK